MTIAEAPSYRRAASVGAGYGAVVAGGMVWTGLMILVSKAASFVAQLALGWLLVKADFALYATAASLGVWLTALKDGAAGSYLIQQGHRFEQLAGAAFQFGLLMNVVAALGLIAAAPFAAYHLDRPQLTLLVWCMAFATILASPVMVYRAKLMIDLRFSTEARIGSLSAIIRYSLMIALAAWGFGALSFVVPLVLVAIYEWSMYRWTVGKVRLWEPPDWHKMRELGRACRWLMLATLAVALIGNGDYIVLSVLAPSVLADYYFGFQLTVGISAVVTSGVKAVLMPAFSRLADSPERQARGFARSIGMLSLLAAPVCTLTAVVAPLLVDAAWQGKWNEAIPVIQVMALSLYPRLFQPVSGAVLEARGKWRLRSMLLVADGLGIMGATAVGATIGGIRVIAAIVASYRVITGFLYCWISARELGIPASAVVRHIMPSLVISGVSGLLAHLVVGEADRLIEVVLVAAKVGAVFGGSWLILTFAFNRSRLKEVLSLIQDRGARVAAG